MPHISTRPIAQFIDEWHRIPTPALGALLAEGRKYGFRLRLANQNAAQIPERLWETAVANCGAFVVFRSGPRDAGLLDPVFPSVPRLALTQLAKHWAAVATDGQDHIILALPPVDVDADPKAIERGHALAIAKAKRSLLKRLAEHLGARLADLAPQPACPAAHLGQQV